MSLATDKTSQLNQDAEYDHLISLIYQGPLEARPWQSALPYLRELFDAEAASLVLRPPAEGDRGVILNSVRGNSTRSDNTLADPNDWQVTTYREQFFALDPFINLPLNKVVTLQDLLSDEELEASDYYRHYLQPVNLFYILGVDTAEPDGMVARLRFSRRREEGNFKQSQRDLLARISSHLQRAIHIFAKLSRTTSERDLYSGAVDQLAVATIILDQQGRLLNTNALAKALLDDRRGLGLKDEHLHVGGREQNRELQAALSTVISAQQRGETSVIRALRIPRDGGRSDLGLVIRPIPSSEWGEGQGSPCAAVFISDPDLRETASQQTLSELFSLTPAEANLAILLSRGLSLAEVSESQHISQHTARAQLKSIFAKTGVSRQAELVRLVLKSVASLG
ncbi:helix-turn-helix transcriptional regulator [Parahaliea sp. F7430]|uniref:Helix-turn-helix transcriptional regulator n=1 Tax=Sediminihaliea albiluteola TaxID=2758564 RepID=A0A7W2TV64_9GAMM|nr:helix-turn-helix transcriptional regulator [Sediminihaliea albiluteola]MBA6412557.1 helix-turn-helix transcriptional regulator [Sediminihaliea albiluteola]